MSSIAVVTPWMNHPELQDDYFGALEQGPPPDELVIVDNGSDPPLEFAAVRIEGNAGFSGGCNAGLRAATADIVVFLNNDIGAVAPGWLAKLTEHVEPGVLAGPMLRYDIHGDVDGGQFPYLDGWCLAGMRDDLLGLHGFDEHYLEPAYFSDNDLCLRARAQGMRLREVPLMLYHKGGQTAGPLQSQAVQDALDANSRRFQQKVRQLTGQLSVV